MPTGRKALEDHLVAMLDLEAGQEPLITLHGPLIEETQKTLARLSVAQRAYELLKSQARSSQLADWVPARQGGPDFALVFERCGRTGRSSPCGSMRSSPMRASAAHSWNGSAVSPSRSSANAGFSGRPASRRPSRRSTTRSGRACSISTRATSPRPGAPHWRGSSCAAHDRQAEIYRARRRRGRDVADQAAARIDPRRDGV